MRVVRLWWGTSKERRAGMHVLLRLRRGCGCVLRGGWLAGWLGVRGVAWRGGETRLAAWLVAWRAGDWLVGFASSGGELRRMDEGLVDGYINNGLVGGEDWYGVQDFWGFLDNERSSKELKLDLVTMPHMNASSLGVVTAEFRSVAL